MLEAECSGALSTVRIVDQLAIMSENAQETRGLVRALIVSGWVAGGERQAAQGELITPSD